MQKFTINRLSKDFYADYPQSTYPEIETKETRPYIVMLIKIDDNTFAIPFRTNVKHKCCYRFKNSNRSTSTVTVLDYSKAVVLKKQSYIGSQTTIDNKEYIELSSKYFFIVSKFKKYLNEYILFASGKGKETDKDKFKYSTLQYFRQHLVK